MARRPAPGNCIHCLQYCDDLTWDHVFPVSWYPDTTPANLEKWKVPACESCNARLGKSEQELLGVLALCVDPTDAHASGITVKVLRSIDPEYANNEKERQIRTARRRELLSGVKVTKEIPKGLFPGFGPVPGLDYGGHYFMVPLPKAKLDEVNTKIIRGLTYKLRDGALIYPEYEINIFYVEEGKAGWVDDTLDYKAQRHIRGPGIRVFYGQSNDGNVGAMIKIVIWNKYRFYCVVHHKDLDVGLPSAGVLDRVLTI